MKRIVIGSLVGTIIYFGWQALMWVGGFHNGFSLYSPNQEVVVQTLNANLSEEGVYFMPFPDPSKKMTHEEHEENMKKNIGKPWAIVMFHPSMNAPGANVARGILSNLVGCFLVCLVLYFGAFNSFGRRYLVSMAFALFALIQGIFQEMNWWSFPWHFEKVACLDLIVGWALCSLWLAWYVRREIVLKDKLL